MCPLYSVGPTGSVSKLWEIVKLVASHLVASFAFVFHWMGDLDTDWHSEH
jgi:hypothetical protein